MVKTYAVKLLSLRCEKMLEKVLLGVSQAKQEQASKFKNKDDAFRSVIGESLDYWRKRYSF